MWEFDLLSSKISFNHSMIQTPVGEAAVAEGTATTALLVPLRPHCLYLLFPHMRRIPMVLVQIEGCQNTRQAMQT